MAAGGGLRFGGWWMNVYSEEFLETICPVLAACYAILAAGNAGAVVFCARRRRVIAAVVWAVVAVGFGMLAVRAASGHPLALSDGLKHAIDGLMSPGSVLVGSFLFLFAIYLGRGFFVRSGVAWTGLNAAGLFFVASLADPHFAGVVAAPDNLPIVAMVFLLGFFMWLAMAQAVENDQRLARGLPPREAEFRDKVFTWPDAIYLEVIGLVAATAILIVWSLLVRAPLEGPANPALTPNPSKAPWYFVGLQEMLVYFDPWLSGVTLPVLIVLGLMAIPYLDFNPAGNGYYTIRQRRFAWLVFLFGFLQLWVLLILIGTFCRGPNWGFYGLYEPRDSETVAVAKNVTLSGWFWTDAMGREPPRAVEGSGILGELACIASRELLGLAILGLYFCVLPVILAATVLRDFWRRMGPGRYTIMVLLLLMMILLPVKMILHWTFHLSYLVSIPEWFLNV
jgi:hypothetical protein